MQGKSTKSLNVSLQENAFDTTQKKTNNFHTMTMASPNWKRDSSKNPGEPPQSPVALERGNMARAVYCGNNKLSPQILGGGRFGKPSECFRKGYGIGYNQAIQPNDMLRFLEKWYGAYEPYIVQHLYYGDAQQLPKGYSERATLGQALQRGWATGSRARAKKEKKRSQPLQGKKSASSLR